MLVSILGVIAEDKLIDRAEEIFMAANYYEMTTLKNIAELALIEQMDPGNMLSRFLMADMYDAKELRLATKNLIIENAEKLVKDEDWKLTINNTDLVFEILEGIALSGRPTKRAKLTSLNSSLTFL